MTPGGGGPTAKVITTGGAGRYCAFPAWVAVSATSPVAPVGVTTFPASETGPEVRASETGSPLEAVTERARAAECVVRFTGCTNVIAWVRSAVKWAMIDLLEFMRTERDGLPEVMSPVQPENALPRPAVATAV